MNTNPSENRQTTADVEALLIDLNKSILKAEEDGNVNEIAKHLHSTFKIIRANGEVEDRQAFLRMVPEKARQGRTSDLEEVRLFEDRAVFTCRVETKAGLFWNTRLFLRENNGWLCAQWQVIKISDRKPTNMK
jgi:hypothetical protein